MLNLKRTDFENFKINELYNLCIEHLKEIDREKKYIDKLTKKKKINELDKEYMDFSKMYIYFIEEKYDIAINYLRIKQLELTEQNKQMAG